MTNVVTEEEDRQPHTFEMFRETQETLARHHKIVRNDMDLIGVRAGCTFTGFAGNGFTGNRATVRAEQWDRWVVFARFFVNSFVC